MASTDNVTLRTKVQSKYLFVNPIHHYLRLLHRAILKYLCGKFDDANEILAELNARLSEVKATAISRSSGFPEDAKQIYVEMSRASSIEYDLGREFEFLLRQVDGCAENA